MEFVGINQANYLDAFKGLSDPCPLVIKNAVNEIFRVMENQFSVAIVFNGWYGIGKERTLKYVAKQAMEAKSFDIVIWMIEKIKASSIRKFQMRVAEQLGIALSKNDDSDEEEDEGTVDEIVSGRITACLETKKFVLVHNGNWGLMDLKKMGIPVGRGADYAMVLVLSSADREYHKTVSVEVLSDAQEAWDIIYEECIDIANCPSLRIGSVTPNDVIWCLIGSYFFEDLSDLARLFWFVIGDARFDMKTAFGFVQVMLKELRDHFLFDIVSLDEVVEAMLDADRDIVRRFVESILRISALEYRHGDGDIRRNSVKAVKSLSPQ
ncbi:hypothetical protein FRX31_017641, partial [Thalictrum thalictroides]